MDLTRAVVAASYGLAAAVGLVVVAATGVLAVVPVPDAVAQAGLSLPVSLDGRSASVLVLVGLPLALAGSVVARAAVTGTPTDVVLAAFAVPCLLVTTWALYSHVWTGPGLYWGGFLSLAAGTLLAVAVLVDGVAARVATRNRPGATGERQGPRSGP